MGVHFLSQYRNPLAYPAGYTPGFDPGHVAARGTQASCVCHGGEFFDILSGKIAVFFGSGVRFYGIDGTIGARMLGDNGGGSTAGASIDGYRTSIGNTNFTLGAVFRAPGSLPASTEAIIGLGCNTDVAGFYVRVENSSGFIRLLAPGSTSAATTTLAVTAGQPYFLAVSNGISTGINNVNYVLKNLITGVVTTTTGTACVPINGTGVLVLGANAGRQFQGAMSAGMVSLSYMSMPQLLQWAADPWSFWYPNPGDNWIAAQAAAGGLFKITGNPRSLAGFGGGLAA